LRGGCGVPGRGLAPGWTPGAHSRFFLGQRFTDLGAQFDPAHSSYSFDGLEGSLDYVLASPGAMSLVTRATIWQINAQESVADQYSRFNYSPTQLFDPNSPWAASDHDPVVVGLRLSVPLTGGRRCSTKSARR
jgi:predicted extracellular nuclease